MKFGVIALFPEMFHALNAGITGRALKNGLISLQCWNPRDFATNRHRHVDDRPYGGGPGMVLSVEPLAAAIAKAHSVLGVSPVIYVSPQGKKLTQKKIAALAKHPSLIWLCGRYEGVDERLIETHVDEEVSIGDYVLSGGELAAMVGIDAITRLIPETLGDARSANEDSFSAGLLDHPHYTRPECIDSNRVPEILISGNHAAIERWRTKQAVGRTWLRRPELLTQITLDITQKQLLDEFISEHQQR